MTGARSRLLAWSAILAGLVSGCTPAVSVDEAATVAPATSSTAAAVGTGATPSPPAAPSPSPSALPAQTPAPTPPPAPQPFAVNLYQEGDFVPQYTFDWCVAASIQMAHNLLDATGTATWSDPAQQGDLWQRARARSSDSFNGANPYGWAEVLAQSGMGPYGLVSVADYGSALRTAARALTDTGRPVGLVMWSGRHAWVMSGFESIGDPRQFEDYSITGIHVLDPLYPYGSEQWGPSPPPNSLLSPGQLATQFVVREPRRWSSNLPAGYLLVLPLGGG
ncbi:MAG: hypothetical protein HOQ04_00210 [Pseudarthrobacter sp.]|nr:hypothetical protein [Pseudarthrobacter sp.]